MNGCDKIVYNSKLFQNCHFFLFISCRKRDDQGKRKNTADRISMCQRLHSSVHSSGCSSIRSRESGRHPFHRIQPLLQLRERINISRQRLQILYLIAPNPTAVHLRQRSSTGGNSTFTRRTQGRNRPGYHTWTRRPA